MECFLASINGGSDDTYIQVLMYKVAVANIQFTGCIREYFIIYPAKLNTKRDSA